MIGNIPHQGISINYNRLPQASGPAVFVCFSQSATVMPPPTSQSPATKVSGKIRTEKRLLSVQIPSKIQSVRIDPGFPVRINGRQRHYPLRQLLFQIVLGLMCPGVPSGGVESQNDDFLPRFGINRPRSAF